MQIFGKRLSALLLVIAILALGVAILPQGSGANAHERQRTFASGQSNLDWESIWEQHKAGRHARGGAEVNPEPSTDSPAPAAPSESEPADETTPADDAPATEDTTDPPATDDTADEPITDDTTDEPATDDTTDPPADDDTTTPSGGASLDSIEAEFLNLINAHRQENGLAPLANNSTLNVSSDGHSLDMAENAYFSHTSQDGSSPFDRMADAGYSCGTMGENIAAGQSSAQQVFEGWLNSPGHNANMLNPSFVSIGIGLVQSPDSPYGYYWTTNFGGC